MPVSNKVKRKKSIKDVRAVGKSTFSVRGWMNIHYSGESSDNIAVVDMASITW